MIKTIMLYPNEQKQNLKEPMEQVIALLKQEGCRILMTESSIKPLHNTEDLIIMSYEDCVKQADFIIVLGGDGTILRVAREASKYKTPILGMNYGTLGFMSDLEPGEWEYIKKALDGNFEIDSRMMLDIKILRGGKIIHSDIALNEVLITKSDVFKIIEVEVFADGVAVSSFRGDGLLIATPTGSTAYSLAAGGPVIEPSAENLLVTPVCPHSMQAQAYIFAPQREISVKAKTATGKSTYVSADGHLATKLLRSDTLVVTKSSCECKLIRVKGESIYHLLKMKLSDGGIKT